MGVFMLVGYLQNILGKENVSRLAIPKINIPIYLKRYDFEFIQVYNLNYVFVRSKEQLNLKSYKHQLKTIESIFGMAGVLVLDNSTFSQRQNLIANKLMFVEINKQLFMPSIGIALSQQSRQAEEKIQEKFTPQNQLCALLFLYNNCKQITSNEIAQRLSLNAMAISRSMKLLESMKVVNSFSKGRTNYYSRCVNKKDYIEAILPYLINPVQKKVFIRADELSLHLIKSGYSALCEYSMLLDNDAPTYAISREQFKSLEFTPMEFDDILYGGEYANIEVWKYDPKLFAEDGKVDKLSLLTSFIEKKDERTEAALEELKEKIYNE